MKKVLISTVTTVLLMGCVHVDDAVKMRYRFDDLYCWKLEFDGHWYPIGEPSSCPEGAEWK